MLNVLRFTEYVVELTSLFSLSAYWTKLHLYRLLFDAAEFTCFLIIADAESNFRELFKSWVTLGIKIE